MALLFKRDPRTLCQFLRNDHRYCTMVQTRSATRSAHSRNVTLHHKQRESPPPKKLKLQSGASRSIHYDSSAGTSTAEEMEKMISGNAKVEQKETDKVPPRLDTPWKIGAHVSCVGGVENAVVNASSIGANAFALFVKSHLRWKSPPLSEHSISEFKKRMQSYGYESRHVVPHGSYLINLANSDREKWAKSYECFIDDLKRCEALGLEMYNFHPGSTVGATTIENSISLIAEGINRAHAETTGITILLENMAGVGNTVGADFHHLAKIIALVEDKSRIGVCFDTCHAFAAGYDLRDRNAWNNTIDQFSSIIGLQYLRAMHLNDSLGELSSRKDRHENIGLGRIAIGGFRHIVRDPRIKGIPLILETPTFEHEKEIWGTEISALGRISLEKGWPTSGMEFDGPVRKTLEALSSEIMLSVGRAKWVEYCRREKK